MDAHKELLAELVELIRTDELKNTAKAKKLTTAERQRLIAERIIKKQLPPRNKE